MKCRRETIAEKGWDGEFETYDQWARFGPQPPYRSANFIDHDQAPAAARLSASDWAISVSGQSVCA